MCKGVKKLKNAVSAGSFSDRQDIILRTLNKINKQAEKTQQPNSIPQNTVEIQKDASNYGCPSQGMEPVDCSEKKDYIKQTLIFHPDKNPKCIEDAKSKFQALQNNTTCKFD